MEVVVILTSKVLVVPANALGVTHSHPLYRPVSFLNVYFGSWGGRCELLANIGDSPADGLATEGVDLPAASRAQSRPS